MEDYRDWEIYRKGSSEIHLKGDIDFNKLLKTAKKKRELETVYSITAKEDENEYGQELSILSILHSFWKIPYCFVFSRCEMRGDCISGV